MGKALGRGFESLIPDELFDDDFDVTANEDEKVSEIARLLGGTNITETTLQSAKELIAVSIA